MWRAQLLTHGVACVRFYFTVQPSRYAAGGHIKLRGKSLRTTPVTLAVEVGPCETQGCVVVMVLMVLMVLGHLFANTGAYQRLPPCLSSMGLMRADMASLALKIRDLTVPIGQAIVDAMSS